MEWLIRACWGLRFRGKVRLATRLAPRSGTRIGRVFGSRVPLDLSDYVQRMMYLGCFELEETTFARRLLTPGMTFVDVGANAGYFTYLAADRVGPAGRVLAVEPDPLLFAKLDAAIQENRLAGVTALNLALGQQSGVLPLFVPPAELANRSPTMTPVPGWMPVDVPVRTLDDLLDECRIASVDLLKIDVEGFEAEVLAGGAGALASGRIRAVLCEFNHYWLGQHGTTPDQVWDTLIGYGFRAARLRPAFPPFSVLNGYFVRT